MELPLQSGCYLPSMVSVASAVSEARNLVTVSRPSYSIMKNSSTSTLAGYKSARVSHGASCATLLACLFLSALLSVMSCSKSATMSSTCSGSVLKIALGIERRIKMRLLQGNARWMWSTACPSMRSWWASELVHRYIVKKGRSASRKVIGEFQNSRSSVSVDSTNIMRRLNCLIRRTWWSYLTGNSNTAAN